MRRSENPEANKLFERAESIMWTDPEQAVSTFEAARSLVPGYPGAAYNIGLVLKYEDRWEDSLHWNRIAMEEDPEDEAARWNAGIAATALRDWSTAREMWMACGLPLRDQQGPIRADFGLTPVRLNPNGEGEVVWAERIGPVRARIVQIPFVESGHRYMDVVLHDGAPTGTRLRDGKEFPVFNVLQRFEASSFQTYPFRLDRAPSPDAWTELLEAVDHVGGQVENWSENVRLLCVACSEGRPHEACDPVPKEAPGNPLIAVAFDGSRHLSLVQQWAERHAIKLST